MKMNRILLASALSGALLTATLTTTGQIARAQQANPSASGSRMRASATSMNAQDKKFVKMVGSGNLAEVTAGKIAQAKSQEPDVKMVAEMLIREHSEADQDLRKRIGMLNVAVPSQPDRKHQKEAAKLQRLSGTAFDKAFIKGQIKDHQATIALFQKTIAQGSNPEVKAYAQKWLPGIREHTKMIYQAANALGVPNAGGDGSGPPAKL